MLTWKSVPFLLRKVDARIFVNKGFRDMTSKRRQNRSHAKISHSLKNLMLQINREFMPTGRQRATKSLLKCNDRESNKIEW